MRYHFISLCFSPQLRSYFSWPGIQYVFMNAKRGPEKMAIGHLKPSCPVVWLFSCPGLYQESKYLLNFVCHILTEKYIHSFLNPIDKFADIPIATFYYELVVIPSDIHQLCPLGKYKSYMHRVIDLRLWHLICRLLSCGRIKMFNLYV